MQLTHILAVAAGSAIGGAGRYLVGSGLAARSTGFPIATLVVNVAGGLAIGLLARALSGDRGSASPDVAWLFLATGVCGGFTTFSAFGLETVRMFSSGQSSRALGYIGASVVLTLLAVQTGLWLGRFAGRG